MRKIALPTSGWLVLIWVCIPLICQAQSQTDSAQIHNLEARAIAFQKTSIYSAYRYFDRAIAACGTIPQWQEKKATLWLLKGKAGYNNGHPKAVEWLTVSRDLYQEQGDSLAWGQAEKHIGISYYYQGEYDQALRHLPNPHPPTNSPKLKSEKKVLG